MSTTRLVRLALAFCPVLYGAAEAATVQHAEPLRAYRVSAGSSAAKPMGTEPVTISFNSFSRDFTLELEPNGRLAAMQAELQLAAGIGAYRGKVAGRHDSWVRIVVTPAGPSGLVFDGETLYGIEAGEDSATTTGGSMFRLADVYFAPGELGNEMDAVAINGDQAVAAMAREFIALAAAGATMNLDLGAVADFEFSQAFGASAETALLTRFNNVDGIFSDQLEVQITVREIDIFTANDDPFTTTVPSALLDELANYRGATPSQEAQGLTHMFTGRDLDGSTVGIAFFGALCARRGFGDTRSFGSGLSMGRAGLATAVTDSLVAAHEIGHNFGAPHDGEAGRACASTPTTFLMAPSINGNDQFSPCSIQEMQAEIAGATCLTPIGPANVTVTLPAPAQNALATVSFEHTATVRNTGIDPATGVTFTASAEAGLQIVAGNVGGAACTVTTTSTTCAIGTVDGGASRSVTLTLRAVNVGAFDLTATVAATVDDDATDNDDAVTVTVVPAVDLVLTGASPGITQNAQTAITIAVENTSDFDATGAAVTAILTPGLRPDQATLGGVACTFTGQAATCPTRSLAARGTVALVVTTTGLTAGNQQVTINASAVEAERTPANNQLTIDVSVNVPPADGGGGGGALSWFMVALLLAARGLRGRTASGRRRPFGPTPS